MLHSHNHASPLSHNQEVSGYDKTDEGMTLVHTHISFHTASKGDNWVVHCEESDEFWHREQKVRFQHESTKKFLQADSYHK
jgi:dolichyl-phosphate-mannose--protein O-mannosyl transferase